MSRNDRLAKIFDEMAREFVGDRYRHRAYKNAAEAIRRHDREIQNGTQAQKEIKGVGKSIGAKIDEIIATGKLEFLEQRPQEVKDKIKVVEEFEKIYGVGNKTAEKWYDMGYHSFESLAGLYNQMTDAQKLGYYYFHQLNLRIPRPEMEQIHQTIDKFWKPLGVVYEIAGSYRRGEKSSGDIDILVRISPTINNINVLLQPLIENKLIVGNLALGPTKYMGIIKLADNMNARRIDIRLVDDESWAYALLYFTGSKQLNVMMRTEALKRDLTMNEYGMVDVDGTEYPARTEQDIFNYLGMQYLEPTQRSVLYKTQAPTIQVVTPVVPTPQKGQWHRPVPSLLIYMTDGMSSTGHIAGFDLDWTLIRPYKKQFPIFSDDLQLLPNRIAVLKQLRERGFTIVIFSNQKSTGKRVDIVFQRLNNFVQMIGDIPIILMAALSDDIYRKPNIGMYQTLQKMIPPIQSAFYCGDAAGRPQDFSDSDKLFGVNNGMKFYTPEGIFPSIERLKPLPAGNVTKVALPAGKVMVLFVGMPGSGKTTYYQTHLQPLGYVHANQDALGTKAKVLKLTRDSMKQGLNVCIDCTNPGQKRRQEFYKIAQQYGYNVVVIYFVGNGKGFNKLRPEPVPTIAYSMYYKYLVEPTPANTPGSLYQIG